MKKVYSFALAVVVWAVSGAMAEEKSAPTDKPAIQPGKELAATDMTVIGTITKHENKKKDGSPMMTWFNLVDEDGKEIRLPKGKVEEYAGAKVKVTGTGYTLEKKGKSVKAFKTITSIEKIEATPAK